MSKRYAFWRDSTGRPCRGEEGKSVPTALLNEIIATGDINDQGQVIWRGLARLRYETALKIYFTVIAPDGKELNETDTWQILREALSSSIKLNRGDKPIKPADILKQADILAAEFFRKTLSPYLMVTSLSIMAFPARQIRIGDCLIEPISSRRRYPLPDTLEHHPELHSDVKHTVLNKWQLIRVRTDGRTIHEAASRAFRSLNLLRGFWTLFATYGTWSRVFNSDPTKALAEIHSGPIHTLHRPDGALAADIFWYEPFFARGKSIFQPRDGWDKVESNRRASMRMLKQCPYKHDIEDLLIRFVSALDYADSNTTFLHLWSIIEKITDTVGNKYDETIRRASWPFASQPFLKDILEALRCRRNQYVHSTNTSAEADQISELAKMLIEPHLLSLIRNDFNVNRIEHYAEYLALPLDIDEMKKKRRLLSRGIRFRKNQMS